MATELAETSMYNKVVSPEKMFFFLFIFHSNTEDVLYKKLLTIRFFYCTVYPRKKNMI
jgi:hypothetical protein